MKYIYRVYGGQGTWSRPARALWIEISTDLTADDLLNVEAREGLVD